MKRFPHLFVSIFLFACGSPQDKQTNHDSDAIPNHGPEGGEELKLDLATLALTSCLSVKDDFCEDHEDLKFNNLGYESENVKSVSREFAFTAAESSSFKVGNLKTENLRCQYEISADSDPTKPLTLKVAEADGDFIVLDVSKVHSFAEGKTYRLSATVENVYYCNINHFKFAIFAW